VKNVSFGFILLLSIGGTATAQNAQPPLLVVRPSGFDQKTDEARAREDRLYRRMQENDYLFRNICVHCGGGINRSGANAPFNPIQALGPAQRRDYTPDDEIAEPAQ
jgi:hypothetical protein